MTLREWRESKGFTLDQAAVLLKAANGSTVSKWERGKTIPRKARLREIEAVTEGAVPPAAFYAAPDSVAA